MDENGLLWWRSDATRSYEGAESAVRDLVLIRPDSSSGKWGSVVVRYRALTTDATSFDFMLQPGGKVALSGDGFLIETPSARLAGRVLLFAGAALTTAPGFGGNINVDDPLSLRFAAPGRHRQMEFLVVLVPLAPGEKEPTIAGTGRSVRIGSREVLFDDRDRVAPRLIH